MAKFKGDSQFLSEGDGREMYFQENPQHIHQFGAPHTKQQMAYDPQQLPITQDQTYESYTVQQESYHVQNQVSYSSVSSLDDPAKQQLQSHKPFFPFYQPSPRYDDVNSGISGLEHSHPESSIDQFGYKGSGQAHRSQPMINSTARNDHGLPQDQHAIYFASGPLSTNLSGSSEHQYHARYRAEMMPAYSSTQSKLGHEYGRQEEMITSSHALSSPYKLIDYRMQSSASSKQGFQHTLTGPATRYGQQNYGSETQSRRPDFTTPPSPQPTTSHASQKGALENESPTPNTKRARNYNGLQNSVLNTPIPHSISQAAALPQGSSLTSDASSSTQERIQAENMLKAFCGAKSMPVPARGTIEYENNIEFLTAKIAQTRSYWNTHNPDSAKRASVFDGRVAAGRHSYNDRYNTGGGSTVVRTPQATGNSQNMLQNASAQVHSQYRVESTTVHGHGSRYRRDSPRVQEGNHHSDSQKNKVQHTGQMYPPRPNFTPAPQPAQIDNHITAPQYTRPFLTSIPQNFVQGINQQATQGVTRGQTSVPQRLPPGYILRQRQMLGVRAIYAPDASQNRINEDSDSKRTSNASREIIDYYAPQYLEMYDYTEALRNAVRQSGHFGRKSKDQSKKY